MKKRILKTALALFGVLLISAPMTSYGAEKCSINHVHIQCIINEYCNQFPGVKPEEKPEVKPEEKPEVKPEVKPEEKPEVKPEVKPEIDDSEIGVSEKKVVELVNIQRATAGLEPLEINTKLSQVAEKKAEDMRDNHYFSHTSPTYGSPFEMMNSFGINYKSAGENIAKGQKSPESVMSGWMNSEGHRANIMSTNFTEIGVGYVTDSNGGTYWVQMFMRP